MSRAPLATRYTGARAIEGGNINFAVKKAPGRNHAEASARGVALHAEVLDGSGRNVVATVLVNTA